MKETNMGLVDDNDTSMGCSGVKDVNDGGSRKFSKPGRDWV